MVSINQNIFTATINAPTVAGTATSTASGAVSGAPSATANVATNNAVMYTANAPNTSGVTSTNTITPTNTVTQTPTVASSVNVAIKVPLNSSFAKSLKLDFNKCTEDLNSIYEQLEEAEKNNATFEERTALNEKLSKAFENYNKAVEKLVEANVFTVKTTSSPQTRSAGGRTVTEEIYDDNGNFVQKKVTKYNSDGNVLTEEIFNENGDLTGKTKFKYDADGNMIQKAVLTVRYNKFYRQEYTNFYDNMGNWQGYYEETFSNATGETMYIYGYARDKNGDQIFGDNGKQVTDYSYYILSTPIIGINYMSFYGDYYCKQVYEDNSALFFDKNGQIMAELSSDNKTATHYDEQGRIIKVDKILPDGSRHVEKYTYDKNGNLISHKYDVYDTYERDSNLKESQEYIYGEYGEVTAITTVYNSDGGKTVTTLEKNTVGQTTKVSVETYNAQGKLVKKETEEYEIYKGGA